MRRAPAELRERWEAESRMTLARQREIQQEFQDILDRMQQDPLLFIDECRRLF